MEAPALRWGVLAPGRIAGAFADAIARNTRQRLVAVGSRSLERAQVFAAQHGAERAYCSYEQLVDDPDVDAVYVASPHSEHRAQALLAIGAGKPVLVEKAFARNAGEASEVVAAARSANVLVMEAMWTRFLPQTDVIAQLLADGALGEVTTVLADHGQYFDVDPQSRLFDPALAGGALLDLGVYPVSFASFVLGRPDQVVATGLPDRDRGRRAGVHGADHRRGAGLSEHHACPRKRLPPPRSRAQSACIEVSGPFYGPAVLTLTANDGRRLVRPEDPITGHHGLCFEAAHLARLVADGATESPLLPRTRRSPCCRRSTRSGSRSASR